MEAGENKQVVLAFLEALCAGDRATAYDAFAPAATWSYPPALGGPGVHRGRDAIFDAYFALDEDLYETGTSSYDIEVRGAIAEGDRVAVEMRHRGRLRDGGAPYEADYHVLYEVRGGKIQAVREYFDSLGVHRLLFGKARG